VHDRSWREPAHVSGFLEYLGKRQDVDEASRRHAAKSMAFLFEKLLKTDVSGAAWHPDRQSEASSSNGAEQESATEASTDGEDEQEQSTLLTRLLFHTSLPINEALDLCAGDVDLDAGLIYVSDPMGTPKQIIELPETLHDPLRRHLNRIRKKHGRRYFDAPLFQARALEGRVDEADDESSDDEAESVPAEPAEDAGDRPASLWGYAEDE
jgi:integrase